MPSPLGRRWCFTINNPNADHFDRLARLDCVYIVYGQETAPTTGTPHLQGFVIFERPVRRNYLTDEIGQGHYELTRGTSKQAADYCKKEGNFEERGTFPASQGKRTDIDDILQWLDDFIRDNGRAPSKREIATHQPKALLRYRNFEELARLRAPAPDLRRGEPRQWQLECIDLVQSDPDDRSIHFYVDTDGGKGKTWLQQYLVTTKPDDVQILGIGKRDDLAHAIDPDKSVFLINVPRNQMEYLQYPILEMLKDRLVFSPKYSSEMKILRTNPHVLVFSNEQPNFDSLTEDRYTMHEL